MKIPSAILDILTVAAPTLATALGGPLAGAAAAVASQALSEYLNPTPKLGEKLPPLALPIGMPTPEQIIAAINGNKDDPKLVLDLRKAEIDLLKYEDDLGFRFAELAIQDKKSSREFQATSGIAEPLMRWGMGIVAISLLSLLLIVAGSLLLIAGFVKIPAETVQMAVGVFGLIGAITGYIATYGTQVLSFYFGDSAGSQNKTQALSEALQTSGAQLGQAAATASKAAEAAAAKPITPPQVVVVPSSPTPVDVSPDTPADPPDTPATSANWQQGPFGGARWQVLPDGILIEGENAVARTVGEPVTVRKIWSAFGTQIKAECERLKVPVEVAVMVIATENGGIVTDRTYLEPDGRMSAGVMQVLPATASEILGRTITAEDLKIPAISLAAGIGYIYKQKHKTWFDPILSAAAYNAGGIYEPRPQDHNRFNLRTTGDHLERAIRWYGDVCFVAKADGWFA